VDLNAYKKNDIREAVIQRIVTTLNSIDVVAVVFVFAKPRVLLSASINPSNVRRKKIPAIKARNIALLRVSG
jgi:hypothetical protein